MPFRVIEPADGGEQKRRGFRVIEPAPTKAAPKRRLTDDVRGVGATFNANIPLFDEIKAAASVGEGLLGGRHRFGTDKPGNVVANNLNMLGEAYRNELGADRKAEADLAQARPKVAALTRGTGMAAGAAVPVGASANLLAAAPRAVNMLRGATTAGLTGATYAAADRGTAQERLGAASRASTDPLTLGLGAAGGAVAPARAAARRGKPVTADVELLRREGVELTPGQMGGRTRKTAEDAGTSLPFVGDAIAARRTEGIETFNKAVVNRALKPLGAKLPDDMKAGTEAVKYAGDLLSKGYDEALPGRTLRADPGFADDLRGALGNVSTLTPDHARRVDHILSERVTSRIPKNGQIDGELYKLIQSDLDYEVRRFTGSTDADQRAIGETIEAVQGAFEKMARRQDPAFSAKIDALDRGWAELTRIETAAAKVNDLSGVFTPSQYSQSIRAGDAGRVRKRGVARGEALSQDLAGAGVRVLPSKVPDSGSPGRAAWGMVASAPGAVLGAVTGGGVGAMAGIGGTAAALGAASRAYTPQAINAANVALDARIADRARIEALEELRSLAAQSPEMAELYREVMSKLPRAAGTAGQGASSQ